MKSVTSGCSWLLAAVLVLAAGGAATARGASTTARLDAGFQSQDTARASAAKGRILGILADQSGAVLRGATLEISSAGSSATRTAVTDDRGRYVFEAVPEGRYRVSASSAGFDPAVRDDVIVAAGHEVVLDFVLTIARQEASVVVTAPSTSSPFAVETDPKAPRQPIPAHDGADYLKTIPGFSVVRKGGTDGDPVLRGMAGSRLGVLLDGQQILGGCGGRMDPPTAYVFPAAYDRITVLKGPQTVLYGAGMSAGTVLFERDLTRAVGPTVTMSSALTRGRVRATRRNGRTSRAAIPTFYVQGSATRSHTDDYEDGSGAAVHSLLHALERQRGVRVDARTATPGSSSRWPRATARRPTPTGRWTAPGSRATTSPSSSTGGSPRSVLQRIEVQSYYNYIDHVMDNYSLRTPGMTFSAMNPDRKTIGGPRHA